MVISIIEMGIKAITDRFGWRHAADAPSSSTAVTTSNDPSHSFRAPVPRDPRAPAPRPAGATQLTRTQPSSTGSTKVGFTSAEAEAYAHATWLIEFLRNRGITRGLLFDELLPLYHEMVAARGMYPRPWNPVGKALRELLGGHKSYIWVNDERGLPHRLRIYNLHEVPASMQAAHYTSVREVVAA